MFRQAATGIVWHIVNTKGKSECGRYFSRQLKSPIISVPEINICFVCNPKGIKLRDQGTLDEKLNTYLESK